MYPVLCHLAKITCNQYPAFSVNAVACSITSTTHIAAMSMAQHVQLVILAEAISILSYSSHHTLLLVMQEIMEHVLSLRRV